MTNKEISESVDRAFRQLDKERQQREQARKNSADNARARMIQRQTGRSKKDDGTGWSKPPLWSN